MQYLAVLYALILITLANGMPVIANRILGRRFAGPLDGNVKFIDGRALFGASKTIRGIVVAILATSACAPLLGLDWKIGLLVAITAMLGDLLSSFLKRRLGLPPSSRATGLDQIPESLFPLLASKPLLSLSALDVVAGTAMFLIGEIILSHILFRLRIRERPY
jgi:CDP-diglyceride synthetase